MQYTERLGKYYCLLKKTRLVDDTGGLDKYKPIKSLGWRQEEIKKRKIIKRNNFTDDKKVKQFLSSCLYW